MWQYVTQDGIEQFMQSEQAFAVTTVSILLPKVLCTVSMVLKLLKEMHAGLNVAVSYV